MYFFSSPVSSINLPAVPHPSPAYTSVAMSRSDSRDSTNSSTSMGTFSTSPALSWADRPTSSSSMSYTSPSASASFRRNSASSLSTPPCGWIQSPFRSCLSAVSSEPSSYVSDDDLLDLGLPVVSIPSPVALSAQEGEKELTTEEQIALLCAQREKEDLAVRQAYVAEKERERRERAKVVRFATDAERKGSNASGRRPSTLKRRTTAVRRNLAQLGRE